MAAKNKRATDLPSRTLNYGLVMFVFVSIIQVYNVLSVFCVILVRRIYIMRSLLSTYAANAATDLHLTFAAWQSPQTPSIW